jgi:P27 family predicted phage terminase small subunit
MAGTGNSGGRNAKSKKAHVMAGTFRATRHGGLSVASETPKGHPLPPKTLHGDALEEWQRMIVRLEQLGVLSTVHDAAIYQYCRLFAESEEQAQRPEEYAAAIQILEDNLSDLKGAELVQCFQEITKLHALRAQNEAKVRQCRMALRQYLVEFGLTPAAIGRVGGNKETGDTEDEQLARLLAVK